MHSQVQFEDLITNEKAGQILPADMTREGLEPLRKRDTRVLECVTEVLNDTFFLGEMRSGVMTKLT